MRLLAALNAAAMSARLLTLLPLGKMIHLARNIALVQVTHRGNFNLNLECGNPDGARRKSLVPDLKALFKRALNKKAKFGQGERATIITKLEAGFDELGDQFAAGDRYARRDVFYYAEKLGIDLTASQGNARHVDVSTEAEFRQALLDRGIPARLLPPIDEAGLEPPPDPPLPPDVEKEENKQ